MKFGGASAPVGAPTSLEILMNQGIEPIDPILLSKVEGAIHTNMLTIIRAICAGTRMTPASAISLVRQQLDHIETMAKEEDRATAAGDAVRGDGDEREGTEAESVVEAEAQADHEPADVRRKRGGGAAPWPRSETHGEWTDDDTAHYGVEPRGGHERYGLRPDVGPNHPF